MNPGKFAVAAFTLLAVTSAAHAQQVRYRLGDDAKWADPSWDDSSWQTLSPGDPFPIPPVADSGGGGILWFRYRVPVPGTREPLAIRSTPDGSAAIANAGGNEVRVDTGLPLGVVPGAEYVETRCQLADHQMTFVSDGVVEAANVRDELFGFERTREISKEPAAEIADAARAWGQNDDITVVTVRRSVL